MRLRFTSVQARNSEAVVAEIAAYLGRRLGIETAFIDDIEWPEREDRLCAGTIDVGWICGLPYTVRLSTGIELLAAPVMEGGRYQDQPVYFSDVLVRSDAAFQHFEDLRGRRWAFNEPHSHSGYNVVRYHVARGGFGTGFFGEVIESGAHEASLGLLLDGKVDASAIDTMVWDREIALRANRYDGRLRSIATLGPSPAPPWVVRKGFPAELRDCLQQALVTMHEDPEGRAILAAGQTRRFAVVTDRDYDPIREMERAANGIQLCRA